MASRARHPLRPDRPPLLDAGRNTSYLLLLDAHDLSEIARAHVPQHIPFGFHGTYTRHRGTNAS